MDNKDHLVKAGSPVGKLSVLEIEEEDDDDEEEEVVVDDDTSG